MPRAWRTSLAVTLAVVVLTSCSSGSQESRSSTTAAASPSTSTAPKDTGRSSVQILSFTGPRSPVQCNAPTQVQLHWQTRGASKVELRIDGGPPFSTYPGGAREPLVPLECDGETHTYAITATGANGDTMTSLLELAVQLLAT